MFISGTWRESVVDAALLVRDVCRLQCERSGTEPVQLSLAAVSQIMKLLGFSAQKPLYKAWQQDTAIVRQWKTEAYPQIRAQARSLGATVYFADEAGIRSDYHTGRPGHLLAKRR